MSDKNTDTNNKISSIELAYREASVEDVEIIARLHEEENERPANKPFIQACIENYLAVICMSEDNKLIGFAYTTRFAPDILELANILVSDNTRSSGVGSKLLGMIERSAQEQKWNSIILVSSTGYGSPARRVPTDFYNKMGYEIVHSTPKTNVFIKAVTAA